MSDSNPPEDEEAKMQAILAAFGEDALSMLDDDDDDDDMLLLEEKNEQKQAELDASSPEIVCQGDKDEQAGSEASSVIVCEIPEDATPLVRYMTELNNAIYTRESELAADSARTPRFIVFVIGEQHFGMPLKSVSEIGRYPRVTPLPCTPLWLRGVTNLRGQIVSVIDFRELLQHESSRPAIGEKIIFTQCQESNAISGIVVDRVLGLRNFTGKPADVSKLGPHVARVASGMASIDDTQTTLVVPDKLFEIAELQAFA